MSYARVAERTGHSIEQVCSHLHHGRRDPNQMILRHA